MLPNLGLNKLNSDIRQGVSVSPRGLNSIEDLSKSQAPLSHRNEQPLTSGQLMTSLSSSFMALGMKELKDELRVAKKAEQMIKEKLQETKKQLETQDDAHLKYKQDAESRIETIKTENRMLQLSIKHMHDQNEALERSSTQSNSQDAFRIVEEYSKQNEMKSKEIEELLISSANKKQKHQQLKKLNVEMEHRMNRLQSKLDNMTKFCRIFIKNSKNQNQSLRDTVEQQQKDFSLVFKNCKQEIFDQIQSKFTQTRANYEQLLATERENVSTLKDSLSKVDVQVAEKLRKTTVDTQTQMQKEIETLLQKNQKLRQKLAAIKVSQSDADEQSTAHQVDVLNLQLQNLSQKYELQISEKENHISGLRETIQQLQSRENALTSKLENVDSKSRQEYQRLVEMYEGSSRFKEIRDLYEEKITSRDQQLLQSNQDLVKCQVRLEVANEGIENMKQKEQKLKQKASEADSALNELRTSSQVTNQALQSDLQQLKASQIVEKQAFMMNQAKEFEEEIQKSKDNIQTQSESVIKALENQVASSKQTTNELQSKVNDLTAVLTVTRDAMDTLISQMNETEKKREIDIQDERVQFELKIEGLNKQNDSQLSQQLAKEQATNLEIEELKRVQKEETMANNWETEDLRQQLNSARRKSVSEIQSTDQRTFDSKGTSTKVVQTQDVSVEAIIINSSMVEATLKKVQLVHSQQLYRKGTDATGQREVGQSQRTAAMQMPVQQTSQKLTDDRPSDFISESNQKTAPKQQFAQGIGSQLSTDSTAEVLTQSSPQSSTSMQTEKAKSQESLTKDLKSAVQPLVQPQTQEAPPSRFYSIITSFMGILSRRKQAFTGKPSTAMYYCKEKNRWIIQGEEESEDETPAPPPPKAKPVNLQPDEKILNQLEPQKSEAVGLSSLTQPVFGGALANRNRAKKPITAQPKLPSTFPAPIKEQNAGPKVEATNYFVSELPKQEPERLNETDLNMTTYTAREYLSQSVTHEEQHQLEEIEALKQHENELEYKCSHLNEKITSMRSQIQNLQDALQNEKKMSQQTIVELEMFSNEMQEAGLQHQKQLNEATDALIECQSKISVLEATNWLAEDNFRTSEQELQESKQDLRNLKQKYFTLELQQQISVIQRQMQSDEQILQPITVSQQSYDELEDKFETLKWQLAAENQNSAIAQDQCVQLRHENMRLNSLVQSMKTDHRDFTLRIKDLQDRNDRDREIGKETHQRLTQEKEVIQELVKKSSVDIQQLARRFDSEKQARQQEFLKLAHEKDVAYQQKLEAIENQKNSEIQAIQAQLETQAIQLQTQVRHEQGRIKKQINSLESVLSKKDEDLQLFIGKNEEAQQEIQSMSEMRQKLNDHVVYLQNEIRKRDELLEDGSDFEDDQELADDSYISVGHNSSSQQEQSATPKKRAPKQSGSKYLEEARTQIKSLINSKLLLTKDVNTLNQQLRSQQSGLEQLLFLLEVGQDKSSQTTNEVIQQGIAKFFQIRTDYESKQMELQHQIDQLVFQVDNSQSLNFEIELLTGERDMLQADLDELNTQAQQLTNSLDQATHNFESQIRQKESEAKSQEDMHKRQINMRDQSQERLKDEFQGQISELRQKIAKQDDYVSQLQAHSQSVQVDQKQYQLQISDLQNKLSDAHHNREESANHFEVLIEELQSAKNEAEEQLQTARLQKSELAKQIGDLEECLQEKIQQLGQADKRLEELNQEFDNVARAFIQKKDGYKLTIQKLKAQNTQGQQDSQEVTEVKAQLAQADSLIQQMQHETEQIVKRMQDKKSQRELKLKEKIGEISQLNQDLTAEIEKLRAQADRDESQQTKQVNMELSESMTLISELKTQIAHFKEAYQVLKEQRQFDSEKMQRDFGLICSENEQLKVTLGEQNKQSQHLKAQLDTMVGNGTGFKNENDQLRFQVNQLESEVSQMKQTFTNGDDRLFQVEEQYQSESQKLAEIFKQKQQAQREKTLQLKQEMRNLIAQCQSLEEKDRSTSQEIEALRTELKHIQEEKLNLSHSLDLTKIQTNREISQMQVERKLFETELEQQLKHLTQNVSAIIKLLDPEAVVVDLAQQALDLVQEWFKNAEEDKRSLQRLVQEKDEMQEETEGLMYKIQILVQERDRTQQLLSLSDNANLAKVVKTLEEERSELRNDFVMKMDSMSQELSVLQDKLIQYEGESQQPAATDAPLKEGKGITGNNFANYKLEADQKATTAKNTSFLASLFLTNSDLSK